MPENKASDVIRKSCREGDIAARIGGDEFMIVLPRTNGDAAMNVKNSIVDEISKLSINVIKCSISVGYDTKLHRDTSIEETMANAENVMYKEKTLNRKDKNTNLINTLISTLHNISPKEKEHSLNVSRLCKNMGLIMNLSETDVKKLEQSAFVHDIGKITFSKSVLKGSNLSKEDEEGILQHSVIGYRILNLFDDTLDLAEGVYSHHENWNGSGYPKGLKGNEIPLTARIIAVAETYDAMTNKYNANPIMKEDALSTISELSGIRFDPDITNAFIDMVKNQ